MRTPNPAIAETFCCVLPASASMLSSRTFSVIYAVSRLVISLVPLFFSPFLFFPSFRLPFSFILHFFICHLSYDSEKLSVICALSNSRDLSNEKCRALKKSFQLSDVARKKNCCSPTNCPRLKKLSNEEVLWPTIQKSHFQLSECRGAEKLFFTY